MYETHITIVGNVLNPPEWRRTTNTGTLVTTFKLASTARRWDRESGQWVDGNSLRLRVNCWRGLASNVFASVTVGDPLIVTGRLHTRDWLDEEGNRRTQYELEATSVGHDLARGRNRFERVRPNTSTSAVEDAQAQQRVGGELTVPVPAEQAPAQFEDLPYQMDEPPVEPPVGPSPVAPPGVNGSGDPSRPDTPSVDDGPAGSVAEASQPAEMPAASVLAAAGATVAPSERSLAPEDPVAEPAERPRGSRRAKVAA